VFLLSLSRKGLAFYERYQGELDLLFEIKNITLYPPLKFNDAGVPADEVISGC
jgi:hypothetical protein